MVLALSLLALSASTLLLALGVEPMPSWYFQCLWWPYLFAVDAWNRRASGRSLIFDHPWSFLRLAGISVAWWTMFEAVNLRLGNWYYVMDHPRRAVSWTAGAVAFATVLPGTLVTLRAIENLGWLNRVAVRPLRWSRSKERSVTLLGALCLVLPLAWPELFFPLVWGSFAFLIAPWNRRHARDSYLRDLESGEAGPLCRTLLAGLACGGVWEAGNYWARTRWIYTVPGFEGLKLFEMPLLGFFGFPPFALECLIFVRFQEALRQRVARWTPVARSATRWGFAGLAVAGTALVFRATEPITTDSHYTPLAGLRVLAPELRLALTRAGLESPEQLLRATRDEAELPSWAERIQVGVPELRRLRERVALVAHRGLGERRALQLAELGIDSRQKLARWDWRTLSRALRALRPDADDPFLERRVRVWLR